MSKGDKGAIIDDSVIKVTIRLLFALSGDYIGDSGGFRARFTHLFQEYPCQNSFSGKPKVTILVILARSQNHPILSRLGTPYSGPGQNRALRGI